MRIGYKIQVFGITRATILHSSIAAWIPKGDEELTVSGVIDLPKIIFPSEDNWHLEEMVRENGFERRWITDPETIGLVQNSIRFVVVQGHIRYQDVFRDVWILPFSLSWKSNSLYGSRVGGHWDSYKDPYGEANREYLEKPGHYMAREGGAEMPSKHS